MVSFVSLYCSYDNFQNNINEKLALTFKNALVLYKTRQFIINVFKTFIVFPIKHSFIFLFLSNLQLKQLFEQPKICLKVIRVHLNQNSHRKTIRNYSWKYKVSKRLKSKIILYICWYSKPYPRTNKEKYLKANDHIGPKYKSQIHLRPTLLLGFVALVSKWFINLKTNNSRKICYNSCPGALTHMLVIPS